MLDTLDYYSKKDIITDLKNYSFNGEQYQKERFELDYIFAKSTKFQEVATLYRPNKWYQILKWPKWAGIFFYDITMGLGYRPFRLIPWLFITLLCFSFWIFSKLPTQINEYINREEKKKSSELQIENKFTTFINCFYVTSGAFFGIRLKQDVLTFFKPNQRWRIIVIWAVGLLMYFYFIYFAKSGSILNSIKGLFTG